MKKTIPVQSTQISLNNKENLSQQSVVRDSPRVIRKQRRTYSLYIPANIDLDDLLNRHPVSVANAKDYIAFLLHQIHAVPAFRNNVDIEENDGFTILNSTILQEKVDNYAPLFEWCICRGLIECDNHTILKKKSLGYRFTDKYRVELKEYNLTLNTLINKILRKGKKTKNKPPVLKPENLYNFQIEELRGRNIGYKELAYERLSHLEKWFHSLNIDMISAEQYLRDLLAKEEKDPEILYPIYNFNCRRLVIEALKNRDKPRFKVDDKAGRLHTNLTSLQAELKAFIDFDGKKIVSADIKNSQPLLSLVFLDEKLFYKNKMLDRIALYNPRYNSASTATNNIFSLCSMLGDFVQKNENNKDVHLYKGLVLNGRIYEYFGKILQHNGIGTNLDDYKLRMLSKRELFRAFFDRNQAINRRDSHGLRLFKSHFPTVFEIFSLIKTGKHNTLACALQNLEAEIVLHKACKTLSLINPEMPLFTIHDSIASTIENYDVVNRVLSDTILHAIDVVPEIKKEFWDETLINKVATNTILDINNEHNKLNKGGIKYGYADENDILKPYTYPMKIVAKKLGLSHITLLKGLREVGIIVYNYNKQNIPVLKLIQEDYFIVIGSKRGRISIQTTRATNKGVELIQEIVKQNPELFPLKKVNVK